MSQLISRLRKNEIKTLNANNNVDNFSFTDADIHAWIDAGELVTA